MDGCFSTDQVKRPVFEGLWMVVSRLIGSKRPVFDSFGGRFMRFIKGYSGDLCDLAFYIVEICD